VWQLQLLNYEVLGLARILYTVSFGAYADAHWNRDLMVPRLLTLNSTFRTHLAGPNSAQQASSINNNGTNCVTKDTYGPKALLIKSFKLVNNAASSCLIRTLSSSTMRRGREAQLYCTLYSLHLSGDSQYVSSPSPIVKTENSDTTKNWSSPVEDKGCQHFIYIYIYIYIIVFVSMWYLIKYHGQLVVTQPSICLQLYCVRCACVCVCVCILCVRVSMCVCTALFWYLLQRSIIVTWYFLPVIINADITGRSQFLQCNTNHFTSICAGGCIDSRNVSLKCRGCWNWGANRSPQALATRPRWIVEIGLYVFFI